MLLSHIWASLVWGGCLPGAYSYINCPDVSPNFPLLYRSPPSRPEQTANLPHKAQNNTAHVNSTTSTHVRCIHGNKQFCPHKCEGQYILHNDILGMHHKVRGNVFPWSTRGVTGQPPKTKLCKMQ